MTVTYTADGFHHPSPVIVTRARRRPALDGIRAIAVTAVVVYHTDDNLLPGGFIGVDLFFVLSGYLITTLLLQERMRTGGVSLRGFWARRVRRLWPLGWLLIAAVGVLGALGAWSPSQQRTLPAQSLAGFANVSNWWQMANGGYLDEFSDPSPLRHLWSLAVEEQMYVLWPIALIGLIRAGRRWGRSVTWVGLGLLAAASVLSAWMSSPERAYLATDSRAIGILVGAGLALAWQDHPMVGPRSRAARITVAALGSLASVGLVAASFMAEPMVSWLHRGGFLAIALLGAALVAVALTNRAARRALSLTPLVWVGERSYAIYLVHWPLVVASDGTLPAWATWTLVLGGSIIASAWLHTAIERPVISRTVRPQVLALGAGVLVIILGLALWQGAPTGPTPQEQLAGTLERVKDPSSSASPPVSSTTTTTCVPTAEPVPMFGDTSTFDDRTVATVVDPTTACVSQVRLLILGDSTGRGISNGINSLGDTRIRLWDRTELGCSLGPEKCGEWRQKWTLSVIGAKPDVVLVYTTVQPDLFGIDDASFLSEEAHRQRVAILTDAARIAGSTGAKVMLIRPALPIGNFYCTARNRRTTCTPEELAAWDRAVQEVATATGATVVDVGNWVAQNTSGQDRPDGLHMSGEALHRHAEWLVPQILAVAGRS